MRTSLVAVFTFFALGLAQDVSEGDQQDYGDYSLGQDVRGDDGQGAEDLSFLYNDEEGPEITKRDAEPYSYCPGSPTNERHQRQIFTEFVETLYGEKNVSKAFGLYVDRNIIEHDPFDEQDRDSIVARLEAVIANAEVTILRTSFNNDTGLVFMRVEEEDPIAFADIYRMDGTCIVEHWDVAQTRPANATNPIGMF
ncbi:hypothetical protein BJY01DRAFT_250946 [Aspergillus pseudoustus]|uniref:SnoaL-like domain-containing protein n=1 Tax=Aspergillus pseudoustus TaxID=1810923 RepID=A0ABR4JEI8_9EURO